MGRPPPPPFGQCPKENVFFLLMSSLTTPHHSFVPLFLQIQSWKFPACSNVKCQQAVRPAAPRAASCLLPMQRRITHWRITAVAASVWIHSGSALPVSSTQQLEPDSGSRYQFALQKAVAARVSGGDRFDKMFLNSILKTLYHRQCHLTKLPQQLPKQPSEDRDHRSSAGTYPFFTIHCI